MDQITVEVMYPKIPPSTPVRTDASLEILMNAEQAKRES